jgi:hypothetical protein
MIDAGIEACRTWSRCDLDESKATDIYREMECVRRRSMASVKASSIAA